MHRLDRFQGRHAGERGVLVANGPSLNQMDLAFLRQETVIGLNKIYLGFSRFRFYPRYLVMVNEKVIRQSAESLPSLNCIKFIGERGAHIIPEDALTHHVQTKGVVDRFSCDIRRGLHEGWTVTHAALQVGYYMGFQEVVIIGMDHRFKYEGAPNETHEMHGDDPNHFSPDYFKGNEWDNPDLVESEKSYRAAREAYEAAGRRVVDATVNGACDVFEKGNYHEIFSV